MPKVLLVACAILFACVQSASAADALILSDVHLNPLADKALAEQLVAAPAEQWAAILDRGSERISVYGEDSDWKLLKSALAAIMAQPKPDFVLVPGDFLAHGFRGRFDASVERHDNAAYRRFVAKTLRFIGLQLEAATGHVPILPALGNNDSDCGDYGVEPGGSFLADTERTVAAMIGPKVLEGAVGDAFARSWTALGDYSVPLAALPNTDVIALNDNFLSPHYRDTCGGEGQGNPARATLAWLARALDHAAAAHRKVILIYHIPPGVDAFATAKHDACPVTPVPLLAAPYAEELHALMRRYRDTIVADIAGHLHTAAFRVLRDGEGDFGFVMITPALSPIFAQNPSFRRIALNDNGAIADVTTFYLANLLQAGTGAATVWQAEASFNSAFGAHGFNAASLEALIQGITTSPELRDRWVASYGVQGPASGGITPQSMASYRCSLASDRLDDFARCLCSAP